MGQKQNQPAPFRVAFDAVRAGLEITTRHWWLILLPMVLDGWLWMGTRLALGGIGRSFFDSWLAQVSAMQPDFPLMQPAMLEAVGAALERFNLFSLLSVPFVGVPVLFSGPGPLATPLTAVAVPVADFRALWLNIAVIVPAGLLFSVIYYSLVSDIVVSGRVDWPAFGRNLLPLTLRLALLLLLICLILFIVMLPIALLAGLASLLHAALGLLVMLSGSVFIVWAVAFLSFTLYALFHDQGSPVVALRRSLLLATARMPLLIAFLVTSYLIRSLGNTLWLAADDGSWLTLVTLFGHAWLGTALVSAAFIFYRNQIQPLLAGVATAVQSAESHPFLTKP